ncbi:MAG: sigma-54-dependent Fis family transcriptional regulator [Deltaproteobacteria bacterium]|nr:sigma-54-dependent Fis family transcriptional regulator [Deltaproteobacteria bacterium]
MRTILVVASSLDVFPEFKKSLGGSSKFELAENYPDALQLLRKRRHDILFIDMRIFQAASSGNGYRSLFQSLWQINPGMEIIVMTDQAMIREAVMAVKSGAVNYLTYPINADEIRLVTEQLHDTALMHSELDHLRDQFWDMESVDVVHTGSPVMKIVFEKIKSVAPTKSTVLLAGETGTGKGVLSKLIHRNSPRRNEQFISVHCGAIPDTLLESELFGHEKGAFTGAIRRKLGKFDIARGGTIFLDEISTITPSAQIKLLQVLQDGIFQRVGGEETIEADVRIIAATNVDLKDLAQKGFFRKDLYYRLNVFPIEIPPLRDRKEDIELLIDAFLRKLNRLYGKDIIGIHPLVIEAFQRYDWPGNIRELQNLVERAYIIESDSILAPQSFSNELFTSEVFQQASPIDVDLTLGEVRRRGIDEVEKRYLEEQLRRRRGRISETAKASGITTRQLHKLMKRHGLDKRDFKRPLGDKTPDQ